MKFYYKEEKRKFDAAWKKTASLYAEQGMPQEAIDAMHDFDWNTFKAERIWALHTQEMPTTDDADEESGIAESPMIKRYFDRFTTEYDTYGSHSRHWWLEELSDTRLVATIPRLTEDDKELLTLYFVEQHTIREIAKQYGVTHVTISLRLQKIAKLFTIA